MFMSHLNQYLWKNNRYGSMFGIYCFLSNYYSKLCMSKMIIPRRFDSLMIQLSSINLERLDLKKPSHRKNLSEPAALQALIIIKHYQLSNVQQYLMLSKFAQFRQKAIHQTPTTHFKNSQKEPEVTQPQQMKNNNSQERATEQRRKRRLSINQENRVNFNRQKYTRVKSLKQQDYSPLKLGKSLVCKSVNKAKDEEKQHLYKKTSNLKLTDYLTLYSMSKRSQLSKSKSKLNNQIKLLVPQPKSNFNAPKSHATSLPNETNYSHQKSETQHHNLVLHHQQLKDLRENRLSSPISNSKLKFAIDTQESIKVVRQETKKSLMQTKKELSTFLETISHSHDIRSDQESLVFMCNVLHIFEDKITQSVKLAQQLIEERNKQKNVRGDKSPSSNSMIRKSRNKKNRSEISETSDYGVK